ncbi:MFS transporter [Saccharopolyspora terrae]|uniref:MFS transporter n=1 Tax=Saccharopolyspora terrae TaxID=2530384 RepID=A0A4R4VNZ5_9PSEU|nr:MFS transporter [Saccharopolyspora terrae]TDD07549.1 MFS transporter [Saccharopolyspora terrae]
MSTAPQLDERMARKAGIAAFVGTTIEWYDFYIYGTASALVFGPLFFSNADPAVAVLLSFGTFAVGFLTRPLGGAVFGHLGDRIGRKRALISTLLLMGVTTVGVGLLPTYATIGSAAPVLLIVLRMLQGLAVGGEWGGAVLIATEHTRSDRGFLFGAFAQQGSPAGRILATLGFLAVTGMLPEEALLEWAWRLPFLASALLVVVGLVIRLKLEESPAVKQLHERNEVVKVPVVEVFRSNSRELMLGIFGILCVFVVVYARDTFALAWATKSLDFSKDSFLSIILIASVVQFFVQPFGAILATRWSPRALVTLLLGLEIPALALMFVLIGTGNWTLAMIGAVLATIPDVMFYAVMAGMLAQSFPTRVRYTGISLTYGLSGALCGTTPMILQWLHSSSGSMALPVAFGIVTTAISLVCSRALLGRPAADETPHSDQATLPGDAATPTR